MIRNLAVQIVKPVNCTWEEAGNSLRAASRACMLAANLTQTHYLRADTKLYEAPEIDADGKITFSKKKENGKPDLPQIDAATEKRIYKNVRARIPQLSSRAVATLIKDVRGRYSLKRFRNAIGLDSSPTYRSYPFATNQHVFRRDGDVFILAVPLFSTDCNLNIQRRPEFILGTSKLHSWQRKILEEIVSKKRKQTTIKIIFNERKKKWMCLIPFEIDAAMMEPNIKPDRVLHVYPPGRGKILRCAFFAKDVPTHKSDVWFQDLEFESALPLLRNYQERARRISTKYRQDSSTAAVGRGRGRAIKNKKRWQAKYRRCCKTLNQQRAAYIVQCALRWRCGVIEFIDPSKLPIPGYNYLESWPWFELQMCIKNAAEKVGIKTVEINPELLTSSIERFCKIEDAANDLQAATIEAELVEA